jgi:hypothetical protein
MISPLRHLLIEMASGFKGEVSQPWHRHKDCRDNRAVPADELRLVLTPHPKRKRPALSCLKEDTAMKKPKPSSSVADLVALVDSIIAYWKSIAEVNFKQSNPDSNQAEFERVWPKTLDNFFLAETIRTANALRFLSEGREN